MMAQLGLFGAATLLLFLTALLYFHGRFRVASLAGLAYAAVTGTLLFRSTGAIAAGVLVILLVVAPAVFLLLHVVDLRRGIFLLPTIYSIPVAFLAALALWLAAGLTIAF